MTICDDPCGSTMFEQAVTGVVRGLEPGEVVSYGEVATQAGYPGAARAVGAALRRSEGLAWWRVVRADGRLVAGDPVAQARLLAAEGVQLRGLCVVSVRL